MKLFVFSLVLLMYLSMIPAQITLYEAEVKIDKICLNKLSEIKIIPKDSQGNLSIIGKINIPSNLNLSQGITIYENNTYIKQVIFNELGKGKIYINISQEEKTLSMEKDVEVLDCSNKVSYDKIERYIRSHFMEISIILFILIILTLISLAVKINKN